MPTALMREPSRCRSPGRPALAHSRSPPTPTTHPGVASMDLSPLQRCLKHHELSLLRARHHSSPIPAPPSPSLPDWQHHPALSFLLFSPPSRIRDGQACPPCHFDQTRFSRRATTRHTPTHLAFTTTRKLTARAHSHLACTNGLNRITLSHPILHENIAQRRGHNCSRLHQHHKTFSFLRCT